MRLFTGSWLGPRFLAGGEHKEWTWYQSTSRIVSRLEAMGEQPPNSVIPALKQLEGRGLSARRKQEG